MKTNASAVTSSGANASGDSEFDENAHHHENRILTQQIIELRRRLDDDHSSYKRKLQHYQESQQKQAQLVSKLQQKVLQYKTKCNELELSLESRNCEMERLRSSNALKEKSADDDGSYDTETLLLRIEEEQQKNLNINHINLTLREQLDQATNANQKLSQEIQKVNHEWVRLRDQLECREREWREEENVKEIFIFFICGDYK